MAGFSRSEMMIVAAARELAGQRVCFVGVGLPNIAVNLAKLTVAPDLELVYESGVFGARPARLPLSIGDPTIVTGATAVTSMLDLFALLPPGRPHRRGLPGRRPDRPVRQHQHDRHRRRTTTPGRGCRAPGGACEIAINARTRVRGHAPVGALVRGAHRLPHLARQPGRRGGVGADPAGAGLDGQRSVGGGHGPGHLPLRRGRRDAPRLAPPGRHARGGAGEHGLGGQGGRPSWRRPPRRRPRSCASSASSWTPRGCTPGRLGAGACDGPRWSGATTGSVPRGIPRPDHR